MEKNNKTMRFKTNINCRGCVERVSSQLDHSEGVCHWSVDTANKDKILSVHSKGISEGEVIRLIQKAGFNIEPLNA